MMLAYQMTYQQAHGISLALMIPPVTLPAMFAIAATRWFDRVSANL